VVGVNDREIGLS
jgi:hypothetical protein